MASQQVLFAETIAGMKKAFKRKAWGTPTALADSRTVAHLLTVALFSQNPTQTPRSTATPIVATSLRRELDSHREVNWSLVRDQALTERFVLVEASLGGALVDGR